MSPTRYEKVITGETDQAIKDLLPIYRAIFIQLVLLVIHFTNLDALSYPLPDPFLPENAKLSAISLSPTRYEKVITGETDQALLPIYRAIFIQLVFLVIHFTNPDAPNHPLLSIFIR